MQRHGLTTLALTIACTLSACQTITAHDGPALFVQYDTQSARILKTTLSTAMNRANIDLGPSDPSQSYKITVLPPPLGEHETNSVATPTQFEIILREGHCFVVNSKTQQSYALKGVNCRPAMQ